MKPSDVEDILLDMSKHGKPHLYQTDGGGWYCKVDLRVATLGATTKIESDFGMKAILSAVQQCKERLVEYLATVQ